MTKCEIEEVINKQDSPIPVIVDFQNGKIKSSESIKATIYQTRSNSSVVAVTNKDMLYAGRINENNNDSYNNYIIVKSKSSNKVRLIQVDHAVLQPIFEKKDQEISMRQDDSILELNRHFGSKRTKRQVEQKERFQMNLSAAKSHLEATVADIKLDESYIAENTNQENESDYKPPINRDAETADDVYSITNLLPENVLNSLEDDAEAAMAGDPSELDLAPFLIQHLKDVMDSSANSSERKSRNVKILLYINFLVKFFATPVRLITKKFELCDILDIKNHLLNNFTVLSNSGRLRPLSMKHKAVCYMLILLSAALDHKFQLGSLPKDIKMDKKKIIEIARFLSFTLPDNNTIVLKLPLPPPISFSRTKRRR